MKTERPRLWRPNWMDDELKKVLDLFDSTWDMDSDEEIPDDVFEQWVYEHSSAMLKKYHDLVYGLADEGGIFIPGNKYRDMSYELDEEFEDILERAGTKYHPADEMSVEEFDAWIYAQASEELKAFLDEMAKSDT